MNDDDEYLSDDAALELKRKQSREAKGEQPRVTCICDNAMPLRFMYRCLYCGIYFCLSCAEVHFGKTRAEYLAERDAKEAGK